MKLRKTKIAMAMFCLPVFSQYASAFVESNPLLHASDKQLIIEWDKQDLKRQERIRTEAAKMVDKIDKVGQGQIQANMARSSKQIETAIQQRVNAIDNQLKQPSTICSMLSNNNAAGAFNTIAKNNAIFGSQGSTISSLDGREIEERLLANYKNNRQLFCSVADQINGTCDVSAEPVLQDGDINAALFFGGEDSTTRDANQVIALDALVHYIAGVQYAPESVDRNVKVERVGTARAAYDNHRRRYASILALATEGLYDTAESHAYSPMEIIEFENTERAVEMAGKYEIGDGNFDVDAVDTGEKQEETASIPPVYFNPTSKQPLLTPARVTSIINPARKHPNTGQVRPHRGTDIGVPIGTPVITLADGKVIASAFQNKGAGNYLVIYHPNENFITRYFHLDKKLVKAGETVKAGQLIAKSGNTGIGTGPHLHYELYKAGGSGVFNKDKFLDYRTAPFPKGN